MKKMKRLAAVFLALAMVLGMSITSFATEVGSLEILIENAGKGATFQHLQLIEPDPKKETGWTFCTPEIEKNFTDAFGMNEGDGQAAIWRMIALETPDNNTNIPQGTQAVKESDVAKAITNVANAGYTLKDGKNVSTAGVYYIRGTEAGWAYNPMAAYVSFGSYVNGVPTKLEAEPVAAKKTEIKTVKTSEQEDKITEIGRVETFYVESVVPFVPTTDDNRYYKVQDTISGAEYVAKNGEVTLNVYFGITKEEFKAAETKPEPVTVTGTVMEDGKSFVADLTDIVLEDAAGVPANEHANSPILITYQAIVTDKQVGNTVEIGDGTHEGKDKYGSDNEELFTGKIVITKVDEADEKVTLKGAGFIISKDVAGEEGAEGTVQYAKFDETNKFVEWTEVEAEATEVFTGADGALTISGLDAGTYHITEKTAPDGYSIRDGIEDVTLGLEAGKDVADAEFSAESTVKDTKLSSLPSTGGIGTTIFTIAGCVIMVVAAGLFFASRRKAGK